MAYELARTKSIKATGSFSGKQFTFVTIDSNGQLATPSAGARAIGVIQDAPGAGDPGAVCYPGDITKVQAGGTINPGDNIVCGSSGKAIADTSPLGSTEHILGIALASASNGDVTTMLFQPQGMVA